MSRAVASSAASAGGHGFVTPASTPPPSSAGVTMGPSPAPSSAPIAQPSAEPAAEGAIKGARIVEREELRAQSRVKSTLLSKKGLPPFWISRDYDTHTYGSIARRAARPPPVTTFKNQRLTTLKH